jgi:hypothetical protein
VTSRNPCSRFGAHGPINPSSAKTTSPTFLNLTYTCRPFAPKAPSSRHRASIIRTCHPRSLGTWLLEHHHHDASSKHQPHREHLVHGHTLTSATLRFHHTQYPLRISCTFARLRLTLLPVELYITHNATSKLISSPKQHARRGHAKHSADPLYKARN